MIKTILKIGNSHGLIFDLAMMDMLRLKAGDQVNVEVHSGGTNHAHATSAENLQG